MSSDALGAQSDALVTHFWKGIFEGKYFCKLFYFKMLLFSHLSGFFFLNCCLTTYIFKHLKNKKEREGERIRYLGFPLIPGNLFHMQPSQQVKTSSPFDFLLLPTSSSQNPPFGEIMRNPNGQLGCTSSGEARGSSVDKTSSRDWWGSKKRSHIKERECWKGSYNIVTAHFCTKQLKIGPKTCKNGKEVKCHCLIHPKEMQHRLC